MIHSESPLLYLPTPPVPPVSPVPYHSANHLHRPTHQTGSKNEHHAADTDAGSDVHLTSFLRQSLRIVIVASNEAGPGFGRGFAAA